MKITQSNIEELVELIKIADEFRPFVRMTIDAIKSYSDEFKEIPESVCSWIRENRISGVKQYMEMTIYRSVQLNTINGVICI